MLQGILSRALEFVEFLLTLLYYSLLGVETLAKGVKVVALALILALNLVELHLALLHLRFGRLHFRHACRSLFLSLVLYPQALFTTFEFLFLEYHLAFAHGFLDDGFCTAASHGFLHRYGHQRAHGKRHHNYRNIDKYRHKLVKMSCFIYGFKLKFLSCTSIKKPATARLPPRMTRA